MRETFETLDRLRKQVELSMDLLCQETRTEPIEQTFRIGDFIVMDLQGFESIDLVTGKSEPI